MICFKIIIFKINLDVIIIKHLIKMWVGEGKRKEVLQKGWTKYLN